MKLKIIEVEYRVFKSNQQTILRDGEIDIQVIPVKGDIIHLDNKRYRVEQRDFVNWNPQSVRLFVTEIL
jgi:hypothetical protein